MKNATLTMSCAMTILLFTLNLSAQFELGLTAGANLSGLNYITVGQTENEFEEIQENMQEVSSTSSLAGFQAGFCVNFVRDRFSIGPELLYTSRAYAGKKYKHRNEYLTIPIRFKYKLGERFTMDLGPEFNCILWNSYIRTSYSERFHEIYHKVDICAAMGVTYRSQYRGSISLRYVQGLTDMIASEHLPVSQRSKSIQLAFSYSIFDWSE